MSTQDSQSNIKKVSDLKGTGFFQTIDQFPAPAPQPTGGLSSQLIEALAGSSNGFHSSQLEAIMLIIEAYVTTRVKEAERLANDDLRAEYIRGVRDFSNYYMDASIPATRQRIMPHIATELIDQWKPPVKIPKDMKF